MSLLLPEHNVQVSTVLMGGLAGEPTSRAFPPPEQAEPLLLNKQNPYLPTQLGSIVDPCLKTGYKRVLRVNRGSG